MESGLLRLMLRSSCYRRLSQYSCRGFLKGVPSELNVRAYLICFPSCGADISPTRFVPFACSLRHIQSYLVMLILIRSCGGRRMIRISSVGTTAEIRSGRSLGGDRNYVESGLGIMAQGRHRFRFVDDLGWR